MLKNNTTTKKKKKKSVILVTQPIASYHFMKFENILYFQGRCMFRRSKQPILSLVFSVATGDYLFLGKQDILQT